ncbi:MAG TPA: phosphotransferase [Pyrinomonadaceae bacterium]|jgi:aminoglycoside/choline kinase family phosphotransferase
MPTDLEARLNEFLIINNQPTAVSQLTQDASTREYFRVVWQNEPAIACVYPFNDLCLGQFAACLDVTRLFLGADLPVARIFATDAARQIVIHEDFGDKILRGVLENSDESARERYLGEAIGLIARIQAATPLAFETNSVASRLAFDFEKLSWELDFFATHYFTTLQKKPLSDEDARSLKGELDEVAKELEGRARVLAHRDFHAANLMLGADGALKIIDHQDARIGAASYDLVSLLLDRVTVLPTPEWLAEKRRFFLETRRRLGLENPDEADFACEFRLQTIQRCLKAIGTFSFQSATRGKIYFIPFIKPMFEIVLRAAENLQRFPNLQRIVKAQISD